MHAASVTGEPGKALELLEEAKVTQSTRSMISTKRHTKGVTMCVTE